MKRRAFITLIGGAAGRGRWRRARSSRRRPIIGFLRQLVEWGRHTHSSNSLRRGLGDAGFVEGHNLVSRISLGGRPHTDRLPALAAELVRRPGGSARGGRHHRRRCRQSRNRRQFQSSSIPAVDPVKLGLSRPASTSPMAMQQVRCIWGKQLVAKQFELMHELLPRATCNRFLGESEAMPRPTSETNDAQAAADALGQKLIVVKASTENDLAGAFAAAVRERAGALILQGDPF